MRHGPVLALVTATLLSCSGGSHELLLVTHEDRFHVLYVDPDDRVNARANEMPTSVELHEVRGLLTSCHYTYQLHGVWSKPIQVLSAKQIEDIAPPLWRALEESKIYYVIRVTTSREPYGLVREDGDRTEIWVYVAGGRWHIGFDRILGHPFRDSRDVPDADSDDDPFLWEVYPYAGQRFHIDREGNEDRASLEIAVRWPDASIDDLPDWRHDVPWEGYERQRGSDWIPSGRDRTDRYWWRDPAPEGEPWPRPTIPDEGPTFQRNWRWE